MYFDSVIDAITERVELIVSSLRPSRRTYKLFVVDSSMVYLEETNTDHYGRLTKKGATLNYTFLDRSTSILLAYIDSELESERILNSILGPTKKHKNARLHLTIN